MQVMLNDSGLSYENSPVLNGWKYNLADAKPVLLYFMKRTMEENRKGFSNFYKVPVRFRSEGWIGTLTE